MSFKTLEEMNSQKFKASKLATWCLNNEGDYSATYTKGKLTYEFCYVSSIVDSDSAKGNIKNLLVLDSKDTNTLSLIEKITEGQSSSNYNN